jgi:hypothetical protein
MCNKLDKRFLQTFSYLILLLISSWTKCWFVLVVLKYLNSSTLSTELLAIIMLISFRILIWRDGHVLSFISVYFKTNQLTSNYLSFCVFNRQLWQQDAGYSFARFRKSDMPL